MKNIITTLYFLFSFLIANSQIKEPVHLGFNLVEENNDFKKFEDEKGYAHFYIKAQHFKSSIPNPPFEEINRQTLKRVKFLHISDFLELANKERIRLIAKGEKDKSIKLLFNNEVFEQIFLYQKINDNCILRMEVVWIEEIK